LPVTIDIETGATIAMNVDRETGLVTVQLAARPSVKAAAVPKVALKLSLHLVSRFDELCHDRL
jgi:L-asparaginase/Glu-tRNA(Gln) amidotransferase subunit D